MSQVRITVLRGPHVQQRGLHSAASVVRSQVFVPCDRCIGVEFFIRRNEAGNVTLGVQNNVLRCKECRKPSVTLDLTDPEEVHVVVAFEEASAVEEVAPAPGPSARDTTVADIPENELSTMMADLSQSMRNEVVGGGGAPLWLTWLVRMLGVLVFILNFIFNWLDYQHDTAPLMARQPTIQRPMLGGLQPQGAVTWQE